MGIFNEKIVNLKLSIVKLIFTLTLLLGVVSIQAKNILYSDPNIQWLGRWNENTGLGKWSGWGGSQVVFVVHGTSTVVVNADVVDPDDSNFCILSVVIDNSPLNSNVYYFTELSETFSGSKSVTITLPDTTSHTIIMHTEGYNEALFSGIEKTTIKSFDIDSTGAIETWRQGLKRLQTVGDSWMAAECDYPRLMDRTKWVLYPVATGGLKASDMDKQYNFNYSGSLVKDPAMDDIIVSFGVNDFNSGVTSADFEKSLESVVDKIQMNQPNSPVFLIQAPKNIVTGKDFGKYGDAMQNIAKRHQKVYYISTRSLETSIGWQPDGSHLAEASKKILADFIDSAIAQYQLSTK